VRAFSPPFPLHETRFLFSLLTAEIGGIPATFFFFFFSIEKTPPPPPNNTPLFFYFFGCWVLAVLPCGCFFFPHSPAGCRDHGVILERRTRAPFPFRGEARERAPSFVCPFSFFPVECFPGQRPLDLANSEFVSPFGMKTKFSCPTFSLIQWSFFIRRHRIYSCSSSPLFSFFFPIKEKKASFPLPL